MWWPMIIKYKVVDTSFQPPDQFHRSAEIPHGNALDLPREGPVLTTHGIWRITAREAALASAGEK